LHPGNVSNLCTPHPEYLALGLEPLERRKNYHALFVHRVDGELLEEIRANTNKGLAVGHDRFKDEIELLTGRRVKEKKRNNFTLTPIVIRQSERVCFPFLKEGIDLFQY